MNRQLNARTIADLNDGTVGEMINEIIRQALEDCDDRPALKTARKLTIELSFKPVLDESSRALHGVEITPKITSKVPSHEARGEYLRTNARQLGGRTHIEAQLPDAYQDGMFEEGN